MNVSYIEIIELFLYLDQCFLNIFVCWYSKKETNFAAQQPHEAIHIDRE